MYEQPYNPYRNNVALIKDYFKQPAVLVLAIMTVVSIVISVVSSFVLKDYTSEIISAMANYFDASISSSANSGLSEALRQASSNSGAVTIIGSIPVFSILTAVGLFLIYFKSRSENPDSSPSAGFMILYILAIISMIGAILLTVAMIAVSVLLFFAYAEMARTSDATYVVSVMGQRVRMDSTVMLIVAIVLTVVFLLVAFFALFVTINRMRYISSVRNSMNTIELSRKGAKPFGVFCVICAALSALSLISSIPTIFLGNTAFKEMGVVIRSNTVLPGVISAISGAVSLTVIILQAKLALGYAKYIDDKKYGYTDPVSPSGYSPAGADTSSTPYSYLAHQQQDISMQEATFVNPYIKPETKESPAPSSDALPTCPACGAPVDTSAPFCGQCGTKL